MTKEQMLDSGIELVLQFCTVNNIPAPAITTPTGKWPFAACAYYRPTRGIVIHVPSCARIGVAGMQWSYPGYAVDRTPYGVVAHEMGHHVDWYKGYGDAHTWFSMFSGTLRKESGEKPLTGYCPNNSDHEWFAEMLRLFITNPDLLRIMRNRTHTILARHFAIVERGTWRALLAHAPARTIEQCQKHELKFYD